MAALASALPDDVIGAMRADIAHALPVLESLRRSVMAVRHASVGAVLVASRDGETQTLWASDAEEGAWAIRHVAHPGYIELSRRDLVPVAEQALDLVAYDPSYHVCWYEGTDAPVGFEGRDIRKLDVRHVDQVISGYSHPEFYEREDYLRMLDEGRLLGGFDERGRLVGFVGEHAEGAIGMLEVFPAYRRQGWARALQSAKMAEHLRQGWMPWCQVFAGNDGSLALQRSLGMRCSPSPDHVGLMPRDWDAVAG